MARAKPIVGLDIGSSSVKLCVLKPQKGGYALQSFGMVPLPSEAIVDGALMNSSAVTDAINELVRSHKVKIKGLSIGEAGIKKAEATGKVYNLAKLEDFNGNYTAAGAEATIAGGGGGTALRNQNGVVVYLASTTRGLNFKLAGEGIEMTLAQ